MKLVSKIIKPLNHFWVEDYTEIDKTFFESIGFNEVQSNMPVSFGGKPTLQFKGSGIFGGMSVEEIESITNAMVNFYGSNNFNIEEINPYD